jgi:hypothetical protein
LADFDPDFALVDFDCDDFVPLAFTREGDATVVAFRFTAIALFMLVAAYASHKPRLRIARLQPKIHIGLGEIDPATASCCCCNS